MIKEGVLVMGLAELCEVIIGPLGNAGWITAV